MPIDLAAPRVFAIQVGKRKYTLTCKPIDQKAWLKSFASIISTEEVDANGDRHSSYDSSGSRLELLESVLIDATGYTPEGTSIKNKPGWQGMLPMSHRRAVADMLASAQIVPAGVDDDFELGAETVTLKALWTANEEGQMQEIAGLKHVFNSPTADHQKRYSRAMSRSVVTGGSRNGQTRWLGAQDVLIEIYDELIVATEGYVLEGEKLVDGSAIVRTAMDAYHKVAAATALFAPAEIA